MQAEHNYDIDQELTANQIAPYAAKPKAHEMSIESLAVTASARELATGSHDRTIKLWDAESLKEKMTLADHREGVWSLEYSQDSSLLVSGSADRSVLVWDSRKGSPGTRLLGHQGKVYCARFAGQGKEVVSCGDFGEMNFWDLAQPKVPVKTIKKGEQYIVYDLAWLRGGAMAVSSLLSCRLLLIDCVQRTVMEGEQFVAQPDGKSQAVMSTRTAQGEFVYAADHAGRIFWYEFNQVGRLQRLAQFQAHYDQVRQIQACPQGDQMLTSARDGSVRLWSAADYSHVPRITANLVAHSQNVAGARFLGVKAAVTAGWDCQIAVWSLPSL